MHHIIEKQRQVLLTLQKRGNGNFNLELLLDFAVAELTATTNQLDEIYHLTLPAVPDTVKLSELTSDYVKRYWLQTKRTSADIRSCGLCNSPITLQSALGLLFLDTNCDCTQYRSEPKLVDWQRIVDDIKRGETHEKQVAIAKQRGINLI